MIKNMIKVFIISIMAIFVIALFGLCLFAPLVIAVLINPWWLLLYGLTAPIAWTMYYFVEEDY